MDIDPRLQQPQRSTDTSSVLSPPTPDTHKSTSPQSFVLRSLPLPRERPSFQPETQQPPLSAPLPQPSAPFPPVVPSVQPQSQQPEVGQRRHSPFSQLQNHHTSSHLHPRGLSLRTSPVPPISQAPSGATSSPSQDQKRPRACESCRSLKVKCEPNEPTAPTGTCRRCARANRDCIFTQPTRKRQKKSDSKVAELEKKIDALTASLNANRRTRADTSEGDGADDDDMESGSERQNSSSHGGQYQRKRKKSGDSNEKNVQSNRYGDAPDYLRRSFVPMGARVAIPPHITSNDCFLPHMENMDVIDQHLISLGMATQLFKYYTEQMFPQFPAVRISPDATVAEVRKTHPMLFLSILAIASGTSHPDLHKALQKEAMRMFAERILIGSEKSMELVQSLLVMSVWYYPPDRYEELKFYTLIHLAAVMALDLGLGKKTKTYPRPWPSGTAPGNIPYPVEKGLSLAASFYALPASEKELPPDASHHKGWVSKRPSQGTGGGKSPVPNFNPFPDPCTIEARRTLLACYWTCSHVAVSLRRPNMMRVTNFMKESVEMLETSPQAAGSDKVLCQWIKTQMIAEELALTFEFDDPSSSLSIQEVRVQLAVRGYTRRLQEWRESVDPSLVTKSVELNYYINILYTHEVALHMDHNVDDFRPPFTERIIREPMFKPDISIAPYHLDSISACIGAAHSLIDVFISFTIDDLHCIPVFTFVRVVYACMILMRISISASAPGELKKVINQVDLRIEDYVNRIISLCAHAAKADRNRPAVKFTMILLMLRSWYMKRLWELEGPPASPGLQGDEPRDTVMENTESPSHASGTAKVPRTPEAQEGFPSLRQPQAPLHLLSNAAVGLQSATTGEASKPPSPQQVINAHLQQQQLVPQQDFRDPQLPQQLQPLNNSYATPPGWIDTMNLSGLVEFQAGDNLLGLGGMGKDVFADETFWGMVEQEGGAETVGWPAEGWYS